MAHTFSIDSVTRVDDQISIVGSVDGVAVNIKIWQSHLQTLLTLADKKTYIAQQMLAALPSVSANLTTLFGGTFSQ